MIEAEKVNISLGRYSELIRTEERMRIVIDIINDSGDYMDTSGLKRICCPTAAKRREEENAEDE